MCLYDVDLQVATVRPRCPRAVRGTAAWFCRSTRWLSRCAGGVLAAAGSRGFFYAMTTPSENAEMHLAAMRMLNLDPSLTRTEVTEQRNAADRSHGGDRG